MEMGEAHRGNPILGTAADAARTGSRYLGQPSEDDARAATTPAAMTATTVAAAPNFTLFCSIFRLATRVMICHASQPSTV